MRGTPITEAAAAPAAAVEKPTAPESCSIETTPAMISPVPTGARPSRMARCQAFSRWALVSLNTA